MQWARGVIERQVGLRVLGDDHRATGPWDPKVDANGLRKETDDYVDEKLATFEITLERTIEAVRRGRERLAGRSALDSLTEDEVDRIKLPEHLEG